MDPIQKSVDCLTQGFWALFFVLYGCWLAAEAFSAGSLLLTSAALCAFVLLVSGMRHLALVRLRRILKEAGRPRVTEILFPNRKIRVVALLCVAVLLLYFEGEVRIAGSTTVFGLFTMVVLNFAQSKPDFQPFRWWTLIIIPVAALTSSVLSIPVYARAPITSISFGVALAANAVARLSAVRRREAAMRS